MHIDHLCLCNIVLGYISTKYRMKILGKKLAEFFLTTLFSEYYSIAGILHIVSDLNDLK